MERSRKPDKDAPFVLNVTPALQEILHARRDAVEAERAAKARRAALDRQLLDVVEPLWREQCRQAGAVRWTVVIDDGQGGRVKVVFPPFCKIMSMNQADELRAIFGDEDFERYFEVKHTLFLDHTQLSAKHLEGLMELLGDAAYTAIIIETKIMARDTYLQGRVLNLRIASLAAQAESLGLAVPVRPHAGEAGTSSASSCNPTKRHPPTRLNAARLASPRVHPVRDEHRPAVGREDPHPLSRSGRPGSPSMPAASGDK